MWRKREGTLGVGGRTDLEKRQIAYRVIFFRQEQDTWC